MADPHIPPKNPTYTTTTTTPPNAPPYSTNTSTTHIHETKSTNWFVYLLGGAVIAVGIVAWLMSNNGTPTTQPTTGNNVTIESPAAAPSGGPVSPAPDAATPAPAEPAAPAPAPAAPAPADPVAPAPADPVAPAPAN